MSGYAIYRELDTRTSVRREHPESAMIHRTREDRLNNHDTVFRTVALAAVIAFCQTCFAQKSPDQTTPEGITSRVEIIVRRAAVPEVLSSSAAGKITSGQIFFRPEDMAEIQRYGLRAIPALSTYILNPKSRVERVAIRLLGAIGGAEIIPPLLRVLEGSNSAGGRHEALLNLKQAPCSKAVASAISRVAENDPDPIVRDQAREEISWCSNRD
jgi:hypothetical protein